MQTWFIFDQDSQKEIDSAAKQPMENIKSSTIFP